MCNTMYIQKTQKPVITDFIKINNTEMPSDKVIHILENCLDEPVHNYDVDETTAEKLVNLGFLKTIPGERQAKLYTYTDKTICTILYQFLCSDDPTLFIKET